MQNRRSKPGRDPGLWCGKGSRNSWEQEKNSWRRIGRKWRENNFRSFCVALRAGETAMSEWRRLPQPMLHVGRCWVEKHGQHKTCHSVGKPHASCAVNECPTNNGWATPDPLDPFQTGIISTDRQFYNGHSILGLVASFRIHSATVWISPRFSSTSPHARLDYVLLSKE